MVELEIHAYDALKALSGGRKLGYTEWRTKINTNIETMNKVRELLLQENLIIEELLGKQRKLYSINGSIAEQQEELVNYILVPYSKITENFIKNTKNIQQKMKSHQRILGFSKKDSKLANRLWNKQEEHIDDITQSIEKERTIRLLILSPVLKTPYKKQLQLIQKKFYESVEKYFDALYEIEPVLFSELWQIIFFRLTNPKPKT